MNLIHTMPPLYAMIIAFDFDIFRRHYFRAVIRARACARESCSWPQYAAVVSDAAAATATPCCCAPPRHAACRCHGEPRHLRRRRHAVCPPVLKTPAFTLASDLRFAAVSAAPLISATPPAAMSDACRILHTRHAPWRHSRLLFADVQRRRSAVILKASTFHSH